MSERSLERLNVSVILAKIVGVTEVQYIPDQALLLQKKELLAVSNC